MLIDHLIVLYIFSNLLPYSQLGSGFVHDVAATNFLNQSLQDQANLGHQERNAREVTENLQELIE